MASAGDKIPADNDNKVTKQDGKPAEDTGKLQEPGQTKNEEPPTSSGGTGLDIPLTSQPDVRQKTNVAFSAPITVTPKLPQPEAEARRSLYPTGLLNLSQTAPTTTMRQPYIPPLPTQSQAAQYPLPGQYLPVQAPAPAPQLVVMPEAKLKMFTGTQGENWDAFIDRWETTMARYGYTDTQLAQILPDSLAGSAYARLKSLFISTPAAKQSFKLLKKELGKKFSSKKKMVWNVKQGRHSIAEYHAEFYEAASTLWPKLDPKSKDEVLIDAFIQGLNNKYKKTLLKRTPTSLEQALAMAEKEEEVEQQLGASGTSVAAEVQARDDRNKIEALERQISTLTTLVQNQTRRQETDGWRGSRGRGRGYRGNRGRGGYNNRGGYNTPRYNNNRGYNNTQGYSKIT